MRIYLLLSFGLLGLFSFAHAQDDASGYSQDYVILIKGQVAGSEVVRERTGEVNTVISTSEHDIMVADGLETKRMTFSTQMVLADGGKRLVSYSCRYTSGNTGDFYEVAIEDNEINRTLSRRGQVSEVSIPVQKNTVILDVNVYYQYDHLVRKYDFEEGGRQLFADFIPVIGNDIPLAITHLGDENLELKSGTLHLRNFSVEFVGIGNGTFWVDREGRLVRLLMPTQDLEVVRKDLMP